MLFMVCRCCSCGHGCFCCIFFGRWQVVKLNIYPPLPGSQFRPRLADLSLRESESQNEEELVSSPSVHIGCWICRCHHKSATVNHTRKMPLSLDIIKNSWVKHDKGFKCTLIHVLSKSVILYMYSTFLKHNHFCI